MAGQTAKLVWTIYELAGLTGGNLLRVLDRAEKAVKQQDCGMPSVVDLYDKREDPPHREENRRVF